MFAELASLGMQIGGTLFGMDKAGDAADDASAAAMQSAAILQNAYKNAAGTRAKGLTKSIGYLQPWEQSGRQSQELLNDALGINGPDRQRAFYANFQNDPGFEAMQKTGIGTVEQSRAVGGGLKSGATMKALNDYGMKLQQSVFQDRLTRLGDVGKMGATTATNMATVNEGAHKDLAGYEVGMGQAAAGGVIGASNAQQMGTQNELSLLGYGMGQMKQPLNDLFKSFGKSGSGPSMGGGVWAGL